MHPVIKDAITGFNTGTIDIRSLFVIVLALDADMSVASLLAYMQQHEELYPDEQE
ncbi:hypothetical protein N9980_01320 [bacterium]|nr:hypothetical protein [bacterium]